MSESNGSERSKIGWLTSIGRIWRFDKPPILIGGCGRTGTSLMSAILGAHPEIVSFHEESYIFSKKRIFKWKYFNYWYNKIAFYVSLVQQGIPRGKRTWCEKTPKNVRKMNELLDEFGSRVKIILMVRNPFDVLTSKHPNLDDNNSYYISIKRWQNDTKKTLDFAEHPQVLIVPYEKLVNDFSASMRKILDFLELKYSGKIEQFNKYTSVSNHLAFHSGKVKPIYTSSVERWKKPEYKSRIDEIREDTFSLELIERINGITSDF